MRVALVILLALICETQMAQTPSPSPARDINAVLAAHDEELLGIEGVTGVSVGVLNDGRTPCLRVMIVQNSPALRKRIPREIEGYRVVLEVTGPIKPLDGS